jgi:hypothetical protein
MIVTVAESNTGHLRWPAFLTPSVGFAAFLAVEFIRSPSSSSGDGGIWLLPIMLIVNVVAFIPSLLGAVTLLLAFRVLPPFAQTVAMRPIIGALVGAILGLPFAYVLNGMPSADDQPRFAYLSMLIGSMVAGGFCALFYLPSKRASEP